MKTNTSSSKSTNLILLGLFVVSKFILQYALIDPVYDLHRDEYLHLDQGKHLAWGYISVPPVTSWISYIIIHLGNSVFWVKFFPALFGALTIVIAWYTVKELKGRLFAQILTATALTFSVLLRINILYQPNSLDILCWTLFYYTILKYFNSNKSRWLWMAAITLAVGFLNKYNVVFLLMGFLPALCISPQRKIILNSQLYIAIFIALLLILPNLVWQYQNHFPVYYHLKTLAATQLINVSRLDFLKTQLIFFYNSIFILVAALIAFFTYQPFSRLKIFFWSFTFTLIVFVYFKAKDYYSLGLYPFLFAFGSVYLETIFSTRWKVYLKPLALIIIIVSFLPFFKVVFPNHTPAEIAHDPSKYKSLGLLRWEDGKDHTLPQDFADMLGWRELAHKVDGVYDTIADKAHTLVYCDNYGEAGAINYYSKRDLHAVSMNADYLHWFNFNDGEIKNILFVKHAGSKGISIDKEIPLFDTIQFCGKIEDRYAREVGTSIFIMHGAKQSINKILKAEIEQRSISHDD